MSSNVIELSEHKTYIELTRRLCYYDYPNLNGVQLNSDTAEERAQTLLMQPVVAKYKKFLNKDDLGGHECSVDSKGNITFGTVPIGVNVSVEILQLKDFLQKVNYIHHGKSSLRKWNIQIM